MEDNPENSSTAQKSWMGSPLTSIYQNIGPWGFSTPNLSPSKYHTVLYQAPVDLKSVPKPHKPSQIHLWKEDYVYMPFAPQNLFPVKVNGTDVIKQRWNLIKSSLNCSKIKSSNDLEEAISRYTRNLPKFTALHYFFNEVLEKEESEQFFQFLLPEIVNLALSLPEAVPGGIPVLKANHCRSLSLSQWQIACILAGGFLCVFPVRKETASCPGINFSRLFAAGRSPNVAEKLKCFLHYFQRVVKKNPKGVVTFERKHNPRTNMPRWDNLDTNLGNTRIHISSTGTIEDDGFGMLQVDFANKNVGGGVLGHGCVQEEIRFAICPELLVGRLFIETLGNHEAIIVLGIERYSSYTGYSDTFKFNGNFEDDTPFDDFGRRKTTVTIIDATLYHKSKSQFFVSEILRELNKAYVGFSCREKDNLAPVATGNWGCGAFGGNANLKSLIQLMACSAAGRDLVYFTFGNIDLMEQLYNMHLFLANNAITIKMLWRFLCRFSTGPFDPNQLFPFIQQAYFDSKNQKTIKHFFAPSIILSNSKKDSGSKKSPITPSTSIDFSSLDSEQEVNLPNTSQSDTKLPNKQTEVPENCESEASKGSQNEPKLSPDDKPDQNRLGGDESMSVDVASSEDENSDSVVMEVDENPSNSADSDDIIALFDSIGANPKKSISIPKSDSVNWDQYITKIDKSSKRSMEKSTESKSTKKAAQKKLTEFFGKK